MVGQAGCAVTHATMHMHRHTRFTNLPPSAPPPAAPQPAPLGMRDVDATKQLRVLAFGDSLTEGWIQSTQQKHPYAWNLERRLKEKLAPRGVAVAVTNLGVGRWGGGDERGCAGR